MALGRRLFPGIKAAGVKSRIEDLGLTVGDWLTYLFDYGDEWWHVVELVKVEERLGKRCRLPPRGGTARAVPSAVSGLGRGLMFKEKGKQPPELSLSFSPQGELLACSGPQPEVWKATGYGTVFVARRVGKQEILFGVSEGGITRLFAKPDAVPGSWRDVSAYLSERLNAFPPMVALPPDLVSEYLYGAYAFSKDHFRFSEHPEAAPRQPR